MAVIDSEESGRLLGNLSISDLRGKVAEAGEALLGLCPALHAGPANLHIRSTPILPGLGRLVLHLCSHLPLIGLTWRPSLACRPSALAL